VVPILAKLLNASVKRNSDSATHFGIERMEQKPWGISWDPFHGIQKIQTKWI